MHHKILSSHSHMIHDMNIDDGDVPGNMNFSYFKVQ